MGKTAKWAGKVALVSAILAVPISGVNAQTTASEPGPCQEHDLAQKVACLNKRLGDLENAKPRDGAFKLQDSRSKYCLSFMENEQSKAPVLLTCDHPPNQNWLLLKR